MPKLLVNQACHASCSHQAEKKVSKSARLIYYRDWKFFVSRMNFLHARETLKFECVEICLKKFVRKLWLMWKKVSCTSLTPQEWEKKLLRAVVKKNHTVFEQLLTIFFTHCNSWVHCDGFFENFLCLIRRTLKIIFP